MHYSKNKLLIIVPLTIFIFLSSCKITVIGNSERGVIFKRFEGGIDTTQVYLPGKYRISNHNRLIIYDIDSKSGKELINVTTKDQFEISFKIIYTYSPDPKKVALLEYYIGKNYEISFVKKELKNASVEYFKDIMSTEIPLIENKTIEEKILNIAQELIQKRYIELEKIQIEDINIK